MKFSLPWSNNTEAAWMDPDVWPIENVDTNGNTDRAATKLPLETILAAAEEADLDAGVLAEISIAVEEKRELPDDILNEHLSGVEERGSDEDYDGVTQAVSSLIDFIVARELIDSDRSTDDVVDELHTLTEIQRGDTEAYFERVDELLGSTNSRRAGRSPLGGDASQFSQSTDTDETDKSVSMGILPIDLAWLGGGLTYGAFDMFSTALVLGNGGEELNPVFGILGESLPAFVAWKTIVLIALFVFFYPDNREKPTGLDWAVPLLVTVVGTILTVNNLLVLVGRGFIG